MKKPNRTRLSILALGCLAVTGCGAVESGYNTLTNSETVEITDRRPPIPKDASLVDDEIADKKTTFDPDLVDRRKLGDWEVNLSEAITSLDIPIVQPDYEPRLLQLWPSYTDLHNQQTAHLSSYKILPSVNMLDGKAKQFDDGLFAALEQAYFLGHESGLASHADLIRQWLAEVPPDSEAANFLAAGLKLLEATEDSAIDLSKENEAVRKWLQLFQRNALASKPISFYTWNDTLKKCWRFGSYFQHSFTPESPEAVQLAAALSRNEALRKQYQNNLHFYASLSNPAASGSILSLVQTTSAPSTQLRAVSLFPQSTSRENELFAKLFSQGIPQDADLMMELVRRIRSGEVDLTPRDGSSSAPSGWYDYQVYALETLLASERGEEYNKLLLSKNYKQRMLDAFKALITKRRETHAKSIGPMSAAAARPPEELEPRLRVEPTPTYFLRTARSYQFLQLALLSSPGEECLKGIKGLRKDGTREIDLATELDQMKNRFYGLYLISCEDIGLRPKLLDGEVENQEDCYQAAEKWLADIWTDVDFAADTRVSVPIAVDAQRNVTRLWVTLGVRLAKLNARYATSPKIRAAGSSDAWQEPEGIRLGNVVYLIPVDEFVELEISGMRSLSREELRAALPTGETREEVLQSLQSQFK